MKYLLDLLTLKKPKWYQLRLIMKNRRIIDRAKYYVKATVEDAPGENMEKITRDFLRIIESLDNNKDLKINILPDSLKTTCSFNNPADNKDTSFVDAKFSANIKANGFDITVSTASITDSKSPQNIKPVYMYYTNSMIRFNVTVNLGNINKKTSDNTLTALNIVNDFIVKVMLRVIDELTYYYI